MEKLSKSQQAELNKEIEAFIKQKDENGGNYTTSDIEYIQQYTGYGGLGVTSEHSDVGLLYEFYTPIEVIELMWQIVFDAGFEFGKNGKSQILEPSCGIGRFLRYVDFSVAYVDAYEYSPISYRIAQISYPKASITLGEFEQIFWAKNKKARTPESLLAIYDLVIGNPPYGDFTGKYANKKLEGKFTDAKTYDGYFLEKGLKLLKPGGLLCFIMPATFVGEGIDQIAYKEFKASLPEHELLRAYRLPNSTFERTSIATDILLIRKM